MSVLDSKMLGRKLDDTEKLDKVAVESTCMLSTYICIIVYQKTVLVTITKYMIVIII